MWESVKVHPPLLPGRGIRLQLVSLRVVDEPGLEFPCHLGSPWPCGYRCLSHSPPPTSQRCSDEPASWPSLAGTEHSAKLASLPGPPLGQALGQLGNVSQRCPVTRKWQSLER